MAFLTTVDNLRLLNPAGCLFTSTMVTLLSDDREWWVTVLVPDRKARILCAENVISLRTAPDPLLT
jgi:hypothetical protein